MKTAIFVIACLFAAVSYAAYTATTLPAEPIQITRLMICHSQSCTVEFAGGVAEISYPDMQQHGIDATYYRHCSAAIGLRFCKTMLTTEGETP